MVQVIKNWHSLPFNEKTKQIKVIEVSADILAKRQVSISVSNLGYIDIQDPLINCQSFGQSGTAIEETQFTLYQSITPSTPVVFKKAFKANAQTVSFKCKVIDATILNTLNGKELKPIMVKRVNGT